MVFLPFPFSLIISSLMIWTLRSLHKSKATLRIVQHAGSDIWSLNTCCYYAILVPVKIARFLVPVKCIVKVWYKSLLFYNLLQFIQACLLKGFLKNLKDLNLSFIAALNSAFPINLNNLHCEILKLLIFLMILLPYLRLNEVAEGIIVV